MSHYPEPPKRRPGEPPPVHYQLPALIAEVKALREQVARIAAALEAKP